jgi:hypothetical protein
MSITDSTSGAIRCKARRHRWHRRQPWHCGICTSSPSIPGETIVEMRGSKDARVATDSYARDVIAHGDAECRRSPGGTASLHDSRLGDAVRERTDRTNRRIVERLQLLRSAKSLAQPCEFSVGMAVEFDTDDGRTVTGTIARLNQRTARVVTASVRWRVSPGLLRRAKTSHSHTQSTRVVALPRRPD